MAEKFTSFRYQLYEVYEEGTVPGVDYPLFITSDYETVDKHMSKYPMDAYSVRWWVKADSRG
ncbi:hypothetical protein BH762_gp115 [Gordonia phage OneUp]|uniref:Uncharacterized protein n=1 Tax=Gordonia phage OneUp TaxID=1838074 RepID=A0A160DHF0_9CAUD|nr:hypothetical protein BH762_gp115 [Gordonia phage OneUp]ANA86404.1 hypothetical protein PBI_ONEUP_69 [Gordonia phage OneUp]